MPGNPLVRFDEGRVGRTARGRPLSYSTVLARNAFCPEAEPRFSPRRKDRQEEDHQEKVFLAIFS